MDQDSTSGRPKLSLRRKKDKIATSNTTDSFTLQITPCESSAKLRAPTIFSDEEVSDGGINTATTDETRQMEAVKQCGSSDNRVPPLDGESEGDGGVGGLSGFELSVAHPDEGLGEYFFCHICQKDLTRFSESRRELHINRCCDTVEQQRCNDAAVNKQDARSAFSCLLCEKSFKTEKVRFTAVSDL